MSIHLNDDAELTGAELIKVLEAERLLLAELLGQLANVCEEIGWLREDIERADRKLKQADFMLTAQARKIVNYLESSAGPGAWRRGSASRREAPVDSEGER